ncbi:conserved hypothetical protein [Trichinella spiralis]|nr:conserved hypothetical protein [Trichinella spiralis]
MCNTGPYVTVDERLIPFKGRCPFRQYMPKKPAEYDIKVWTLCDAKTSYAFGTCRFAPWHEHQGMRVVLDITGGFKGNSITCDNFFTSHELAMKLFKKKLTIVDTIMRSKPELPQGVLECTAVHIPKMHRIMLLLSAMYKNASLSTRKDYKPERIVDYKRHKRWCGQHG